MNFFFEIFAGALAGLYAIVPVYGVAIILLTVIVRLLLFPLTVKQTRSMREMQMIQPEMKKLQAKYKGNRQKLNEEMMKLYKEHNVNPFGGCLPLLMQFPVFIALYRVLYTPLEYMGFRDGNPASDAVRWVVEQGSSVPDIVQNSALATGLRNMPLEVNKFLGLLRLDCSPSQVISSDHSLSVPDVPCGTGFVDFIPYLVLMLLMGFTTYYQQKQMTAGRTPGDPQAQQMQTFMKILPLMLLFFSYTFPSGLTLYWLTTNVWTIGQQRVILAKIPPIDPGKKPAPAEGGGSDEGASAGKTDKKPAPAGPTGSNPGKPKPQSAPKPHPSSKKKRKKR
jgi:YidC/Oxa1 family membrane protein insertase